MYPSPPPPGQPLRCMCGNTFVAPPGATSVVCPFCHQQVMVPIPMAVPVAYARGPYVAISESRRSWAIGLIAAAVVLLLVGTFTRSWLTFGHGDDEAHVGLLGVEECDDGECETEDYGAHGRDGFMVILGVVGKVAVAGTLALIAMLAWTGARVIGRRPAVGPSIAGTVIAALAAMGATMWMLQMKKNLNEGLELGYSYALYVVGAVSAVVACSLARGPGAD